MNGKINIQKKVGVEDMIGRNKKFAISSMETEMFDELDTFDDMFKAVRKMRGFV